MLAGPPAQADTMKTILVSSYAIHPGVHKLARTLSNNGHDVKLLVWDRDRKLPKTERTDSFTVHRFRLKAPYGSMAIVFYHPLWWLYGLCFFLRERPEVIHACNLDTLPPAIVAKTILRNRLCYTIYDLYGSAYPGPVPSALRRLTTFLEKLGIGFTDVLFLVSERVHDEIRGAHIKKLVYVYNSPEDCTAGEVKVGKADELHVFYAGWMGESRGLREMIDALSGLDGISLVMAGKEMDPGIVEYGKAKLSNFEYLGWIPYEEVIRRSIEADVLFVFYHPERASFGISIPNKVFEAMMCGKPLLVNEGINAATIVERENSGIVVPYGDVNAIREAILRLRNDLDLRRTLGENGRTAYETRYSWNIMESRLASAYNELDSRADRHL